MSNVKQHMISCSDHYEHRINVIADYLRTGWFMLKNQIAIFHYRGEWQFLSHIPAEEIAGFMQENSRLVVVEDTCENSGIKERLSWELTIMGQYQVDGLDLGHRYVTHGSIKQLHEHYGLSGEKIAKFIMEGVQK